MRKFIDSGVDWIGEIPDSWHVGKVKHAFVRKKAEAKQEDPVILSLARTGVRIRDISNNEGQIAESYYNYNPVEPGDFLMNPMDLYSGANCSISHVAGVISPAYFNLGAKEGYCAEYYDFYFKTQYWAMALFAHGKGVSFDNRWTLNAETLFNYFIPVPPFAEQQKIANYLTVVCTELDRMIEQTKQSIAEYWKLKQSVIMEAVTKGIGCDQMFKNSGIDWIGDIPSTWDIKMAFQLFSQVKNKNTGLIERNLLSLSYGKIKRKSIDSVGGLLPENFEGYNIIEPDDIVLRLTDLQNDHTSLRVGLSKERGIVTSAYVTIRNKSENLPQYLYYFLHSFDIAKGFYGMGAGVRQGLNWDGVKKLKIVLPPIDEQRQIVEHLESKCLEIDQIIAQKEIYVDEIEAYRRSLIYQYVTGKKEVPACQ